MNVVLTNKNNREKIELSGRFHSVDRRSIDSKNRITLSERVIKHIRKRTRFDSYQVFINQNGYILLRPVVEIPSSEAWVYQNPQVIGRIRKGVQDIQKGKTERVDDLDSFLDEL